MGDDGDLVRDRAVEPRPAHRPGAAHGIAEVGGGDLAVDVAGVEAGGAVRGLDHHDRRVPAGGWANEPVIVLRKFIAC